MRNRMSLPTYTPLGFLRNAAHGAFNRFPFLQKLFCSFFDDSFFPHTRFTRAQNYAEPPLRWVPRQTTRNNKVLRGFASCFAWFCDCLSLLYFSLSRCYGLAYVPTH